MLEHALLPVVAVACTGIGYVVGALLASANTAFIIRDKDDAQEAHSLLADKHNLALARIEAAKALATPKMANIGKKILRALGDE